MPPQLLKRVKPTASYQLSEVDFSDKPQIAQGISNCLLEWSRVDLQLGVLFLILLGVDRGAGAELWNSFESSLAKNSALSTIAHVKLSGDKRAVYDAIVRHHASCFATRNKIAHWLWGNIDDFPDGMVLINPRDSLVMGGKVLDGEPQKPSIDHVYLYREADLSRDVRDFKQLQQWVFWFSSACTEDHPRRDEILFHLTSDEKLGALR